MSGTTLAATVHYRGRCWDVLKSFELVPSKAALGWINLVGAPGHRRVYPNVDALWHAEVFERFREWFDLTLATAQAVMLYGAQDGTTWAELASLEAPFGITEIARFPLWDPHVPLP